MRNRSKVWRNKPVANIFGGRSQLCEFDGIDESYYTEEFHDDGNCIGDVALGEAPSVCLDFECAGDICHNCPNRIPGRTTERG